MDITNYPLSGIEMMTLNPDAHLYKYTDLFKFDNIEDVFGNKNKVIILYLIHNDMAGHWVCLFRNNDKYLNFFDSYGVDLDYQLDMLDKKTRKRLNEEQNYLKQLLDEHMVLYNNITYQKPKTATCGCFVSHRLANSHLTDMEYLNNFIKHDLDPDRYVAEYCFKRLNYI